MNLVALGLSFLFCAGAGWFMSKAAHIQDNLEDGFTRLAKLNLRMTELEADFGDRFTQVMQRFNSRESMRNRRSKEEPEDLKPNGGLIRYDGLSGQHKGVR